MEHVGVGSIVLTADVFASVFRAGTEIEVV
jgi:hypothetical protein